MISKTDSVTPDSSVNLLKNLHSLWPSSYKNELSRMGYKSTIGDISHPETKKYLDSNVLQGVNSNIRDMFLGDKNKGYDAIHNATKGIAFTPHIDNNPSKMFRLAAHEHGHMIHNLMKDHTLNPTTEEAKALKKHLEAFNSIASKKREVKIPESRRYKYPEEKIGNETFAELHRGLMNHIYLTGNRTSFGDSVRGYIDKYGKDKNGGVRDTFKVFGNMLLLLHNHLNQGQNKERYV
jgi:hypothetical protein